MAQVAEQMPSRIGPLFARNALIPLPKLSTDSEISGWREVCHERVEELFRAFCRGEFGMSVTCDVQVLDAAVNKR